MAETMKDYEAELEASFKKIEEGDILTGTVVTHILQKAFFKHVPERTDCRNAFFNTLQSVLIAGMLFKYALKRGVPRQ